MEIKIFGNKKIKIRKISANDMDKATLFADYDNRLIEEKAYIYAYKKINSKEKKEWLAARLKKQNRGRAVFLVCEYGDKIIGNARIELYDGNWDHQAEFDIDIADNFRGIGLGTYLTEKLIEMAKNDLHPKPVRLVLGAFAENTRAINLYEKSGFAKVAIIPGQYHYQGRFVDEVIMVLYL